MRRSLLFTAVFWAGSLVVAYRLGVVHGTEAEAAKTFTFTSLPTAHDVTMCYVSAGMWSASFPAEKNDQGYTCVVQPLPANWRGYMTPGAEEATKP